MKKGCNFCIIEVPCLYSVTADSFIHPPRISICVADTNITKTYPVNLALLHSFFEASHLQSIQLHTTFSQPLNISLPPFNVYEHNYSDLVDSANRLQFSLKRVVNKTKQNSTIYNSILESVLNGELSSQALMQSSSILQSMVISAIPIIVSVLSLCISICLWFKNRKLALLVSSNLLCKAPTSHGLPTFVWSPSTTTSTSVEDLPLVSDVTSDMTLHILPIVLCTSVLIILIVRFCKCSNNIRTKLCLDIMSERNTVHLQILNIDLPPVHYTFESAEPIVQLHSFHLPCTVSLSWNGTIVTNSVTKHTVTLPSKLVVGIATWIKLKFILRLSHKIILCHQFKGFYDLANVKAIVNDDAKGTIIKDSDTAKLYPVINTLPASAPTYP